MLSSLILDVDDLGLDPRWQKSLEQAAAMALRPAKRIRPLLFLLGHAFASGRSEPGPELARFAASLELLHTFMLVHDDVADDAATRRGGPALHRVLGKGRCAENQAVVVGDHLFARSIEAMLEAPFDRAPQVARYMLQICRHTAAGQFLDLDLDRSPLARATVFQALKIARLKTARYGFVAPLVAGAMLGEGSPALLSALERVGNNAGLAFQLRDDLLGLFGDTRDTGKGGFADFEQGKRTFPLLAAWTRADPEGRALLEELWGPQGGRLEQLDQARATVTRFGGDHATERVITRLVRGAQRATEGLPSGDAHQTLKQLLERLSQGSRR